MAQRITVIQGHPDPNGKRFCHALAEAYLSGARQAGCETRYIDVARLDFPVLRTLAEFETGIPPQCIIDAQAAVKWADHLVIIHPLWLASRAARACSKGARPASS